jgi:CPA2 family monovalent cation:H+ antiporter-2
MSAGMFIDLSLLPTRGFTVLIIVLGLLAGKAALIAGLARILGHPTAEAVQLGLLLSQAGEFAFVLLTAGISSGSLTLSEVQPLTLAVALSMLVTPLLAKLGMVLSYQIERRAAVAVDEVPEETENLSGHVVIAGYGRVGEAVAKRLAGEGKSYIAIDLDPHRIAQARSAGQQVYFGDATQADILSAVQIDRASALVVAVSNPKAALQIVAFIRYIFPELQVLARARNRQHARELEEAGAHVVVPELVATGHALAGSLIGSIPAGIGVEKRD